MSISGELYEKLAAIEHERWADWQSFMHSLCEGHDDGTLTIPANKVARWERQIATPYAELSEQEKQSDREQVDRYWPLVNVELERLRAELDRFHRPTTYLPAGSALQETCRSCGEDWPCASILELVHNTPPKRLFRDRHNVGDGDETTYLTESPVNEVRLSESIARLESDQKRLCTYRCTHDVRCLYAEPQPWHSHEHGHIGFNDCSWSTDAARRYPNARCPWVPYKKGDDGSHLAHRWGDPVHWCNGEADKSSAHPGWYQAACARCGGLDGTHTVRGCTPNVDMEIVDRDAIPGPCRRCPAIRADMLAECGCVVDCGAHGCRGVADEELVVVEWHMGRSWSGHPLEDECPCPKAQCGLILDSQRSPLCELHKVSKTVRQSHRAELCPSAAASDTKGGEG